MRLLEDRPRLHARVVEVLVGRIAGGELQPGQTLPTEAEMAVEFSVSRTVVREALRILGEKGVVEVRQGLGTRVTDPLLWDPLDASLVAARRERGAMLAVFSDLLEARRIVECEVAALAAERADAASLAAMNDAVARMRAALDDPPRFIAADTDFHVTLIAMTGNRVLTRMFEPMRELVRFGQEATDAIPGVLSRALQQHVAIAEAIERRDAAGAREAMLLHLSTTERDVKSLLEVP